LRAAHLTDHVFAVLQHTGLQPFLDESHNAPVRYFLKCLRRDVDKYDRHPIASPVV
jgi:hypothetical protein